MARHAGLLRPYLEPIMDKTAYKTQLTYPTPTTDKIDEKRVLPALRPDHRAVGRRQGSRSAARTSPSCSSARGTAVWATDCTPSWPQRARGACMAGLCAILPIAPSASLRKLQRSSPRPMSRERRVAAGDHRPGHRAGSEEKPYAHRRGTGPRAGAGGTEARCPAPAADPAADRPRGAIARHRRWGQPAPGAATINEPALLVFVSFSMPDMTLARLVDQAARTGDAGAARACRWLLRRRPSCVHKP